MAYIYLVWASSRGHFSFPSAAVGNASNTNNSRLLLMMRESAHYIIFITYIQTHTAHTHAERNKKSGCVHLALCWKTSPALSFNAPTFPFLFGKSRNFPPPRIARCKIHQNRWVGNNILLFDESWLQTLLPGYLAVWPARVMIWLLHSKDGSV